MSKEVVIVGGVRTPVGLFGGALKDLTADQMLEIVFKETINRTGIDPKIIDGAIAGCIGMPSNAANVTRVAAMRAGLKPEASAYTVQRNCSSGILSITSAYQAIQAGDGEIFLVGGTESMSTSPYVMWKARWGYRLRHGKLIDGLWEGLTDPVVDQIMGRTAENVAEKWGITREEQDKFALWSHQKALKAQAEGRFKDQIVPIEVNGRVVDKDEGPNPKLTLQILALYPTIFKENGTVTPGNACPLNDGAASMLVMTKEKAEELGLEPEAYIVGYAYAATDPAYMGEGPIYAVPKAFEKTGLTMEDIDFVELNEAFAAQAIPCMRALNIPEEKLNVWGGAIALGHPVGATGSILTVKLIHILKQLNGRYGLVTMCVGGGQGGALIIERRS